MTMTSCTPKVYASYQMNTPLQLSQTEQLITGWTPLFEPKQITESNGIFTVKRSGVLQLIVERIYINEDQNPSDIIYITIDIKKNGATAFTRVYPISAATSRNEPSIDAFTTPILINALSMDEFEVYTSAEDDGSDPDSTYLSLIKITAHRI